LLDKMTFLLTTNKQNACNLTARGRQLAIADKTKISALVMASPGDRVASCSN